MQIVFKAAGFHKNFTFCRGTSGTFQQSAYREQCHLRVVGNFRHAVTKRIGSDSVFSVPVENLLLVQKLHCIAQSIADCTADQAAPKLVFVSHASSPFKKCAAVPRFFCPRRRDRICTAHGKTSRRPVQPAGTVSCKNAPCVHLFARTRSTGYWRESPAAPP